MGTCEELNATPRELPTHLQPSFDSVNRETWKLFSGLLCSDNERVPRFAFCYRTDESLTENQRKMRGKEVELHHDLVDASSQVHEERNEINIR